MQNLIIFSPVIALVVSFIVLHFGRKFLCATGLHKYGTHVMQSHGMVFLEGRRGVRPVTRHFVECRHCKATKTVGEPDGYINHDL